MRKLISKILIMVLIIVLIPIETFATGMGDNSTSDGGSSQNSSLGVVTNSDPFTKLILSSSGEIKAGNAIKLSVKATAAESFIKSGAYGRNSDTLKLKGLTGTYTVAGATSDKGKVFINSSGNGTFSVKLGEGTTYVTANVIANYQGRKAASKAIFTKTVLITLKTTSTPPGCSISGPSTGVVGKSYTFTGSDWVNTAGASITKRVWSLNSSSAKFTSNSKTASMTPSVPSPYYELKYTVTDSQGKTATATKTVNITNNGPVITLISDTPLAITQTGKVTMNVDTKGLTLTYKWGEAYTDINGMSHCSFNNAVDFVPPKVNGSGSFRSTEIGQYKIAVTATDTAGKQYDPVFATIQVVGPLQAAISAPATVLKGTGCKATDISTILAPAQLDKAQWSIVNPAGKITPLITDPHGSISIDTSKVGTYLIRLTATAKGTAYKSTADKTIKVVETMPSAEEVAEDLSLFPDTPEDLLSFDDVIIPDAAGAMKHMVKLSDRGLSGNCSSTASRQNHVGEKDSSFQYWKVTVTLSEYNAANLPIITPICKDKVINNGDPDRFSVVFPKVGKYQVYGSKWYYCEKQWMYTHYKACTHDPKHSNPHRHCRFLQYQGGAIIEKHGEIGPFEVVITPSQVGKPIWFDKDFEQHTVKTESYLVE